MGAERTGWAARDDTDDVVGIGGVGLNPRSPAEVEDGRQSTNTFGRVTAAGTVEAHLDGLAVIPLARGCRKLAVRHRLRGRRHHACRPAPGRGTPRCALLCSHARTGRTAAPAERVSDSAAWTSRLARPCPSNRGSISVCVNAMRPGRRRYSAKPASSSSTRISKRERSGTSSTRTSAAVGTDIGHRR